MKIIISTNGYKIKVDDEDYARLVKHRWYVFELNGVKRAARTDAKKKKTIHMPREIMNVRSSKKWVDHKKHDTLDNRKKFLRVCSPSQNMANQRKSKKDRSSKYKGVSWSKKDKVWQVHGRFKKKRFFGGMFNNEKEAAIAYDRWAEKVMGRFACLNFKRVKREARHRRVKDNRGRFGFIGVYFRDKKFYARVRDVCNKSKGWYGFNTAEEAAHAYDKLAKKFHGNKAKFNFT